MAKYRLTRAIWTGVKQLAVGTEVEFKDEPTGVYRGRCERVGPERTGPVPATPKADKK